MNFNYNWIKKEKFLHNCRDRCKPWLFYFTSKKLILNAKKNGAHAAKFQTYKAEKLAKIDPKLIGIPLKKN